MTVYALQFNIASAEMLCSSYVLSRSVSPTYLVPVLQRKRKSFLCIYSADCVVYMLVAAAKLYCVVHYRQV
jgi:hypothetical protein